jgi:phenylacetic acid degradation operon negative regulatory protein
MTSRRPQELVFTLFGEYLLRQDRPIWVGSLIAFLKPFRVNEGAVRTVLSRMSRKRWLTSKRSGRNSYYALTPKGRRLVEEGEEHILHPPRRADWDRRWCLLTYSIPEDVRHLRDRLRLRLAWMGFGSLGNGVWISPHPSYDKVTEMAQEMGLEGNLVCFDAHQLSCTSTHDLVSRCWDLPKLQDRYQDFLARWQPEMERWLREIEAGEVRDDRAFRLRFQLIHEFRAFPLEDPFLPDPLLPAEWAGWSAGQLFNRLHGFLEEPSARYVEAVLSREPPYRGRSRSP